MNIVNPLPGLSSACKRFPTGRTLLSLALGLAMQQAPAQTAPSTVTWGGNDGETWTTGFWDDISGSPQAGDIVQLLAPALHEPVLLAAAAAHEDAAAWHHLRPTATHGGRSA